MKKVKIVISLVTQNEMRITSPSNTVTVIRGSKAISKALRSLGITSVPLNKEQEYLLSEGLWDKANRGSLM